MVVVVRGGPFSVSAYRPDAHAPATFNADLCRRMRAAAGARVPVVLQGSVIDPAAAQAALDDGTADLVEMTRAQIADPRLVTRVRDGAADRVRPCILCNQACHVRDNRNPIVSCVGEPRSGHETTDPDTEGTDPMPGEALVVGGGIAGLECARVLAGRGHRVRLVERGLELGGVARAASVGPGRDRMAELAGWLEAECRASGVEVELGIEVTPADLDAATARGAAVVIATGSRPRPIEVPVDGTVTVVDGLKALAGGSGRLPDGPVVVHDPVGGPIGVGVAEWLAGDGRRVSIVTPDQIAGTQLAITGDLADANTRLQRAGVRRELRALLRGAKGERALLDDVWTGERREVDAAVIVDCGHRLPEESLYEARPGTPRAGDCVAPRTILEAVLEGRRRALEVGAGATASEVAVR
jgi:2,4-dienoyl-CoA reductase (NADPH2)